MPPNNKITKVDGNNVFHITILQKEKKIKPEKGKFYHYYVGNVIQATESVFQGKVLDGKYLHVRRDKTMIEKGLFDKGLKSGEWITWHGNGHIRTINHWKDGKRDGIYNEFYANGQLHRSGAYKEDRLHGKVEVFDQAGNKILVEQYKQGELKKEKTKGKAKKEKKENKKKTKKREKADEKLNKKGEAAKPKSNKGEEAKNRKKWKLNFWPFHKKEKTNEVGIKAVSSPEQGSKKIKVQ